MARGATKINPVPNLSMIYASSLIMDWGWEGWKSCPKSVDSCWAFCLWFMQTCQQFPVSKQYFFQICIFGIFCHYTAHMRKGSIFKQLVLSVRRLSVVITKIARSPHLGIWATYKYDESVEIGKKLASNRLTRPTNVYRYGVFNGHAYRLQAMCSLLMRRSPK